MLLCGAGAASPWLEELLRDCANVWGGGGRMGISAGATVGAGVRVLGGIGSGGVLLTSSPARSMRVLR